MSWTDELVFDSVYMHVESGDLYLVSKWDDGYGFYYMDYNDTQLYKMVAVEQLVQYYEFIGGFSEKRSSSFDISDGSLGSLR